MTRCDWCHRRMWPWQAQHHGYLHIEHASCHQKRGWALLPRLEYLPLQDLKDAWRDKLISDETLDRYMA